MPSYDAANARLRREAHDELQALDEARRGRRGRSASGSRPAAARRDRLLRRRTVPRDNGSCTPTTSALIAGTPRALLHVGELRQLPRAPHAEPHVVVGGPERRRVARPELAHAVVRRASSSRGTRNTAVPWWSIRFSPTPGRSTMQSTPTSARWPAGPIPDRNSSVGDCSAPAERITRAPRTCCSAPSRGYSTPIGAAALEQHPRHLGARPDRQVLPLPGEGQVGQRGRHADAVAPVHGHRPDARGVRRVEVVDPGDPVVHDRGARTPAARAGARRGASARREPGRRCRGPRRRSPGRTPGGTGRAACAATTTPRPPTAAQRS